MKNREKYAEEIKNYNGRDFCKDFIYPVVFNRDNCNLISCGRCAMLTALWLDEEYEEPEVDWSKVAVDTPILVRNSGDEEWRKRHFAKWECEGRLVYTWRDSRTSWTEDGMAVWKYAKLAETEGAE